MRSIENDGRSGHLLSKLSLTLAVKPARSSILLIELAIIQQASESILDVLFGENVHNKVLHPLKKRAVNGIVTATLHPDGTSNDTPYHPH